MLVQEGESIRITTMDLKKRFDLTNLPRYEYYVYSLSVYQLFSNLCRLRFFNRAIQKFYFFKFLLAMVLLELQLFIFRSELPPSRSVPSFR
jgi:hypothetical protein